MSFVVIHPEDERQLTLRASSDEIHRLLVASAGAMSHALFIAKGSTDVHFAWLDISRGIADGPGQAASAVHQLKKSDHSDPRSDFEAFMSQPYNQALLHACQAGKCAIIFAGTSARLAAWSAYATNGNFFMRLTRADLEAADVDNLGREADFERFVALEWNVAGNRCFVGATSV